MIESKFLGDGSGCKCRRRSTLGTRVADHTKLPPDLLAANAPSSQFSHAPLPLSTLLPPASVSSSYNLKNTALSDSSRATQMSGNGIPHYESLYYRYTIMELAVSFLSA